jgi:hypothetical protein
VSGKKPKLALVGEGFHPANKPPRPLGKHGSALWKAITAEFDFPDAPGREMLAHACDAQDRAAQCAEQIRADGPVLRTKTGVREHPACRVELANRSFVVRTLARLGLDYEAPKSIGRPPRPIGWTPDF